MSRLKPDPHIIADVRQAEGALAEIAALERKLAGVEAEMQAIIDTAKASASEQAIPLQARRKELADALAVFAKLNRQELFSKAKSLDLGFGVIGFRAATRIVQVRGVTAEMTLGKMREFGLLDGIRHKEEVNRENALGWPDERLELVGLKRQQTDSFFVEVNRDELPDGKTA